MLELVVEFSAPVVVANASADGAYGRRAGAGSAGGAAEYAGAPWVALNVTRGGASWPPGGRPASAAARYVGGSGNTTLRFAYEVTAADDDAERLEIACWPCDDVLRTTKLQLNGTSVVAAADPDRKASVTLPAPAAPAGLAGLAHVSLSLIHI